MEYRYALVCCDDCHSISLMLFKTLKEAQKGMREKIKWILVPKRYTEKEFEEAVKNGCSDDFHLGKRGAWVSVPTFGWMDLEIFDLMYCKKEEQS